MGKVALLGKEVEKEGAREIFKKLAELVFAAKSSDELKEIEEPIYGLFRQQRARLETSVSFQFTVGDEVWFLARKDKWRGKITKRSDRTATVEAEGMFGQKATWKVGWTLLNKVA